MMINIYGDYKITSNYESSYINEEDSTPNDVVFSNSSYNVQEIINGGLLLERIGKHLLNADISEVYFDESFIKLEFFNPTSREAHTINIVYERIIKK